MVAVAVPAVETTSPLGLEHGFDQSLGSLYERSGAGGPDGGRAVAAVTAARRQAVAAPATCVRRVFAHVMPDPLTGRPLVLPVPTGSRVPVAAVAALA